MGVFLFGLILRPSNRVTLPFITPPGVETRAPEDVWNSVACPVKHCRRRLRTSSPVQSSPVHLLSL